MYRILRPSRFSSLSVNREEGIGFPFPGLLGVVVCGLWFVVAVG